MGTKITNCYKLFCYVVQRDQYNKFISTKELSEQISANCFNNLFTTDTGKPSKNMPYLDGIDNEDTVFTCQILNYSSSSPCNSEISTISDITITTALTTAIYHMASKKI